VCLQLIDIRGKHRFLATFTVQLTEQLRDLRQKQTRFYRYKKCQTRKASLTIASVPVSMKQDNRSYSQRLVSYMGK